ncbi:MAG TPA: hypothetical protein VFT75_02915, partial [Nocardioidaceae bacterium]|nr:hypothetical protein [Nocardioidaceae bacterium]
TDRPIVRTMPVGDTREALADLAAGEVDAPDRIARWTRRDTLAQVWERLDDSGRAIMGDLRHADVWGGRGARDVNVSALARRAYGNRPTGKARAALASVLADVLADMREIGRRLPREALPTMPTGLDPTPGTLRDTRVPTSGTASLVVRSTAASRAVGAAGWLTLDDRSIMISDEARATALAHADVVPAYDGGRVAEVTRASLDAAWETAATMPARRPAGVPAGARYGVRIAGNGTPEPRPQGSRRRKRDGGIGSPMVPA